LKFINIFIPLMLFFSNAIAQYEHVLVFFNKHQSGTNKQELSRLYNQHLEYIEALRDGGLLTAYGAFENGEGVAVFVDSDIKAVRDLAQKDPLIISNVFRAEYLHTDLRFGAFCPTADEEMEKYNFVRYTSHITKFNVQHVPQLLKMHDDYLKKISTTGNVLVEGVFSNSDGGFMIIQGDLAKEVITSDPAYQAGFTIPEINDVFMANGVLCED
jgi:uncharacterized protein YciI